MPKVSVVIPLYNKEPHIGRAINSVLSQTVQDFEIIVVNDGSTDNGANIVENIKDNRIKLINQPNQGVSAARNKGIEEAKADLIAFLDADDAYKPRFIETVLRLFEKYPHAGAFATAYEICEYGEKKGVPRFRSIDEKPWEGIISNYFESALGPQPVSSSSAAVPKRVFSVVGGFPSGEVLGEDLDMWCRVALAYPVAFSTGVGATYYRNIPGRACDTHANVQGYRVVKTLEKAMADSKVRDKFVQPATEFMHRCRLASAAQCILAGKRGLAKKYLRECSTQLFRNQKLWWFFWSMVPYALIKIFLRVKRVGKRCAGI